MIAEETGAENPIGYWLGMGNGNLEGSGWWWLPSPARPRIGVPCDPAGWAAALDLLGSSRNRRIGAVALKALRLFRAKPHVRGPSGESPLDGWLGEIWPGVPLRFAIYRGTPNVFVKDTIQCQTLDGSVLGYVKVPRGAEAARVVSHEAGVLELLERRFPGQNFHPCLLGRRGGLTVQSAPSGGSPRSAGKPAAILHTLAEGLTESFLWADSPVRRDIAASVAGLDTAGYRRVADRISEALALLDRDCGDGQLHHPFSHGDFIPWNFSGGDFLFDWEWSDFRLPWHDAFHYLWMPAILSRRSFRHADLWNLWKGPVGNELRRGVPAEPGDTLFARAYLTWQASFYAAASVRNGDPPEGSGLLDRLHSLMIHPPGMAA